MTNQSHRGTRSHHKTLGRQDWNRKIGAKHSNRNAVPTTFVVVGDELAAGAGPFGLSSHRQRWSFPAQAARCLGMAFHQPELPNQDLGTPVGALAEGPHGGVSLRAPIPRSTRSEAPSTVALPGIGFREAISRRVSQPLVGSDPNQTLFNLTLGLAALLKGRRPLTPVEMAASLQPDLALINLGYHEACRAAAALDPALMPSDSLVREALERICATLGTCRRFLSTIPDPLDSAYFLDRATAGRWWQIEPNRLGQLFDWPPDHLLPRSALERIGPELIDRKIPFLTPASASELRDRVKATNLVIRGVAEQDGADLLDLELLFRRLSTDGVQAGGKTITADPTGGFFCLAGFLPNPIGHGIIAERLLELLRPALSLPESPRGIDWTALFEAEAGLRLEEGCPIADPANKSVAENDSPLLFDGSIEPDGISKIELGSSTAFSPVLIPHELTFELGPDDGCFDLILEARDPDLIFGGPAISRRGVTGSLRLRFFDDASPAAVAEACETGSKDSEEVTDADRWVRFELDFDPHLAIDPGPLAAPHLLRHDLAGNRLWGKWTGRLDRCSGRVTQLRFELGQDCSFCHQLVELNTDPPSRTIDVPRIEFSRNVEGHLHLGLFASWTSTWGACSSSSLHGKRNGNSTHGARLPWLPSTVSVACQSLTLHGRLAIRVAEGAQRVENQAARGNSNAAWPPAPRSIMELTSFSPDSRLQASAAVDAPPIQAKTHWIHPLVGRLVVQTGEPTGSRLPLLIRLLPFEVCSATDGWLGLGTTVRFGRQVYPQPSVSLVGDSRSLSLSTVDRFKGECVGPVEFRLTDNRRLLANLQAVEPSITVGPIAYSGRSKFEVRPGGELYYFFNQEQNGLNPTSGHRPSLSLEPGHTFPAPHGAGGYSVQTDSRLDFGLQLTAGLGLEAPTGRLSGEERLLSSTRRLFSFRYMLSTRPSDPTIFEFTDHTLGGTFVLQHLGRIVFGSSPNSRARKSPDTVTFNGFGTWSLDPEGGPVHRIAAHLCRSRISPFIAITLDEGRTSAICTATDWPSQ